MSDKQLYEKRVKDYSKIYPLTYMRNILDENGNNNLVDIFKCYNHIYVTYANNVSSTRLLVPEFLRKYGLWISYEKDGKLYTEAFLGSNVDAKDEYKWIADSNWEYIPDLQYIESASSRIPNQAILPEHLSNSILEMISNAGAKITNLVDEEDLTEADCHVIKLKDRKYNKALASGLGYKILRKNWINGKNILTQDMINEANTVYEVRYDYDLNGETINIPERCTLNFNGGSIKNGKIIGNNTDIDINNCYDVYLEGLFKNLHSEFISFSNNTNPWACFPKLNGKYIITVYKETKGSISLNGRTEANDSDIKICTLKATPEGYTQMLDLSSISEDIVRIYLGTNTRVDFDIYIPTKQIKTIQYYDTFKDLENDITLQPNTICFVQGYYKKYDGGDAFWFIEPISKTDSLSNSSTIYNSTLGCLQFISITNKVINNGLRAMLMLRDKKINVLKLGIKNTGEDTTNELKEIINGSVRLGTIAMQNLYFPGGRYYFTDTIEFPNTYIGLEGDMPIQIKGMGAYANSSPIWQDSDYDNSVITSADNGNSITIFRFNLGNSTNKTCIKFNGSIAQIKNITFCNNSFKVENPLGGKVTALPKNPLNPIIIYEGIKGIENVSSVQNCAFFGFSDIAIDVLQYAFINHCYFKHCNICISGKSDINISDIRAAQCVTISNVSAISQISNIRGDSVRGPVFIDIANGSIYSNIIIDYCLKSCFRLEGENVTITAQCSRDQINSWNNNVDADGNIQLDECFIYNAKPLKGLKLDINLFDSHAHDDAPNVTSYDGNIIYPCVIGAGANIERLDAHISYGGKMGRTNNSKNTIEPSLDRFIQLSDNATINGKLVGNNDVFILKNYSKSNKTPFIKNNICAGVTSSRPININIGFEYFDTTLNKPIWWNGTKWIDSEGNNVNSIPITSGTFANKPAGVGIGYAYFCTDKQTTEGSTNGIMIYYKGSNTWVDALGRVVS